MINVLVVQGKQTKVIRQGFQLLLRINLFDKGHKFLREKPTGTSNHSRYILRQAKSIIQ